MKHLQQPTNRTCGQTSVAMALGKSVKRVISIIGKGGTNYNHLREAIRKIRTHKAGPVVIGRYHIIPSKGTFIARVIYQKKPHWSHFVVVKNGLVFDPSWPFIAPTKGWLSCQKTFDTKQSLGFSSWMQVKKL